MDVPECKLLCEHGSEEVVKNNCKPCEEEGKYTAADGLCQECEESMCSTCFRHHKKGKFCKDHVLIDLTFNDSIDSKDFETVVNDVNECSNQSEECLSAIQTKRDVAEAVHAKFIADAEAFRDEIVDRVYKLTADICKQATDFKYKNINIFGILEKDASNISQEISSMEEALQSQQDQPNKLFVTSIQINQTLQSLKEKLDENQKTIENIELYTFQEDDELQRAVLRCNELGVINRCSVRGEAKDEELETSDNETKQTTVNISKAQPLLDRQLRADNIDVDGNNLSFSSGGLNGVYIGDIKMTSGCYFEVEIIRSGGSDGSVGIGLVPQDYPLQDFPGWRKYSAGYHSDDGRVYIGSSYGEAFGPPCGNNDRMGCGISYTSMHDRNICFSRNGRKIGERFLHTDKTLYPAIALDTYGQKVKVILEAQPPNN